MSYHGKKGRVELQLHPLLAELVQVQQRVLDSPKFQGDWRNAPPGALAPDLLRTVADLLEARGPDEALARAADVANLAAFIVDAVRASTMRMMLAATKSVEVSTNVTSSLIRQP